MHYRRFAQILWHCIPLLPLAYGRFYAFIAMILMVGLAYVKAFKLSEQLREAEAKSSEDHDSLRSLRRALRLWSYPTFLSINSAQSTKGGKEWRKPKA